MKINKINFTLPILFLGMIFPLRADPQPGEITEIKADSSYTAAEIDKSAAPLFDGFTLPKAVHPVKTYRIRYLSTDFDGTSAVINAQLFIPILPSEGERAVYVFGSGTTGISDSCAPGLEKSDNPRWGRYRENMLAYAGQGYIVLFPDYLGFGDPERPQRYFSKSAEGHTMLDGIRAVYNFFRIIPGTARPSRAVFVAGYSQGGHAALAAADMRSSYAPEVPLTGAIGYGSTNDVTTLLREGPYYAPYIFYSYAMMYGWESISPSSLLQPHFESNLKEDVNRLCVEQIQEYYPFDGKKLYTPEFHSALYSGTLSRDFPELSRRLVENKSGLEGHGIPVLIIQGRDDIIIRTPSQTRYVGELRAAGSSVQYRILDGVRHRHTRPAGFLESLAWMENVQGGSATKPNLRKSAE